MLMALMERYIGTYFSAESAASYIDAQGIINAANSIKTELDEFSNLSEDVKKAGSDLNPNTLLFDGEDFSPVVDDIAASITQNYTSMVANLDQIITAAEGVYNSKQEELNQIARYRDLQEINRRAAMRSSGN